MVFSGEADLNTNDAGQCCFDTHYCYDPHYCSTTRLYGEGDGLLVNGQNPWILFGTTPGFSSSHEYTYVAASLPGNQLSVGLRDVDFGDNQGTWAVDIYRD